ncbi:MAG TPA: hypothetical protein VFA18_24920 [Gemmataceae bacterium]|nr:hypothetical protein [Gemmataceae bacterium]
MISASKTSVRGWWGLSGASAFVLGLTTVCAGQIGTEDYIFEQDLRLEFMMDYGDMLVRGHLDVAGNLVPIPGATRRNAEGWVGICGVHVRYLAWVAKEAEPVYEFRSGRLVPGVIGAGGHFVPTVGAPIIDFKDYRYGDKARRIYNLPGQFVKRAE